MVDWQPDWATLNLVAEAFLQSTPLAAQIASVTPPGSHAVTGLQLDLGAILSEAPVGGTLVIAVDTLSVPEGNTAVSAAGVEIIARNLQVAGGGAATLQVTGTGAAFELTTARIDGTLSVSLSGGTAVPIACVGGPAPQTLTLTSAAASPTVETDALSIADVMHAPWSQLSLQLSSAIAGVVADQPGPGPLALAESMLRWVTASGQALLAHQASFPALDYADVASMIAAAASQLTATQTAASGAIYVPILSADLYRTQVNEILGLAHIYDGKISVLQAQQNVQQELAAFATTLGNVNQQAEGPLIATLQNLASETAMLETRLMNAAVQFQQITDTLPALQRALVNAISEQFQQDLVSTAINTLFTLATLYIGAAAATLGDPEVLAGKSAAQLKAALEITKSLLDAAETPLTNAIANGIAAGQQLPSDTTSAAALEGGQVLASSVASFGAALKALWVVVGIAIANAPNEIIYSPDFLSRLEAAPDLSGFTTGGVDPVTYWNVVVTQTRAAVQPHADLPQAAAYLTATKLAATYGSAIGDLQMKLLDLYRQGVSTFARLQAIYRAKAEWQQLQLLLTDEQQQAQAAIGLLRRSYLDVKRALVAAIDNFRAAFRYQWLQDSDVSVDVSMDYLALVSQANRSIDGLVNVLSGTPSGPLQPRQAFDGITYTVTSSDGPLFTEVDGVGQAQWSIAGGDPVLSGQLGGNTALYLSEATFVLEGVEQSDEVELEVATSGRYESGIGGAALRFVSQAVSMNNCYRSGTPPRFISRWSFADAAAYMMPTPYTNWTVRVRQGEWQGVTGITLTLSGKFLQSPTGRPVSA